MKLSVIVLLTSVLLARLSFAATFYVATNGDYSNDCAAAQNPSTPKRNITGESGGVSCLTAGNGDILDIRGGTYSDHVTNVPSGTDWSNAATIRAHGGETVTLIGGIALEGPSYVIFDGFRVITNGLWVGSTFEDGSNAGHHIRFVNLDVGPVDDGHLLSVSQWGHHVEVLGGKWHDAAYGTAGCSHSGTLACYAFYIDGQYNLIDNAKIYDNPSYAIHNYSGYPQRADQNVYRFNEIYNNGNNPASSQISCAILLGSGDGNEAYGNIVRNNYVYGIASSFGATNSLIYNNTVYNNGSGGISWGTGSGTIIKNNIVYNNRVDFVDTDGVQAPTFANNLCSNAGPGCAQSGDPLFADPMNDDFTLLVGSPAKGAGTPYINANVSMQFTPDIGAILP